MMLHRLDENLMTTQLTQVKIGEDLERKEKKQLKTARHSMPIMKVKD